MSEKKLFLLDGHALVYRAYFAFIARPLINSKGVNTSAISGFTRTVWDIIRHQGPTHIAVSFDPIGKTFRHRDYPLYKANRDAQPEVIADSIPVIKKILDAMNIPVVTIPDYEADDVIGTLAKQAEKEGFTVYMVTPDKDYAQLVSQNIYMWKPAKGGNPPEVLGEDEIKEKWQIDNVLQVIDILGLQGDSADNIPGIPGIGAKTAVKLLAIYGSVENLIASAEELKGRQKENVINFAEQGILSKKLATIKLDVPIQFDANAYKVDPYNKEELVNIFQDLEFRTLARQVLGELGGSPENSPKKAKPSSIQGNLFGGASANGGTAKKGSIASGDGYKIAKKNIENSKHKYHLVDTLEEMEKLATKLAKAKTVSFDTETTGIDANIAELVGMSFSIKPGEGWYVPVPEDKKKATEICAIFKPILEDEKILKVGQNIKYDILMLKWYDITVVGPYFDTMIAHYLVEPDLRHKLDYLTEAYLDYEMVPIEALIGKRGKNQLTMRDIEIAKVSDYACEDADLTLQMKKPLDKMLREKKVTDVYKLIEEPLVDVLAAIEFEGINMDAEFLNNYSKVLEKSINKSKKLIFKKAGVEFNIASPKQVGQVLFEKLEIPYRWKKSASGQFSTNVDKLNELAPNHEIVNDILNFRKLAKLKSTYVDALPLMVNPKTKRVHTNFNQTRAATGRLSSENPNLQNIPIKNQEGREIRKAFIPRDKDHILLAADYSQIELRLIAEISKDKKMLEAFQKGLDFHRATAAQIYEVAYDDVDADQRRNAKTVNFSITYGAGATNLSRQLDISRKEATELISAYFESYASLKKYMDDTIAFAREHGYVQTMMGRKRELRDINSRNGLIRSNAERMAINTPVQGTAADMIKLAMIQIHQKLNEGKFKTRMVLQVHDELVFDVYKPELEKVKKMVKKEMQDAVTDLKVPIIVEMDTGENWLEAH